MNHQDSSTAQKQQAEAGRYALLLIWATRLGLVVLVLSFSAYLFGMVSPHVPVDQLPDVWGLPLADYLKRTATPTGWGWVALARTGDFSNLIGIALLVGASLPPLLALIPLYLKRRDLTYAVICFLIALVLALAASGLLTGGH